MQYGRIRTGNPTDTQRTVASIGELLENEFERSGMPTKLPMDADWGYTFRTKVGKQTIDVSVVHHDEYEFGIALESPKNFFEMFFDLDQGKAIESAKTFLTKVVTTIMTDSTLTWYSKREWLEAFESDFWRQRK